MSSPVADLRFGWRLLLKQPAFTAVMILTLAMGIGVNTAISSVVNAILIDPWPYDDPEELIALRGSFETNPSTWVSYLEFQAWQQRSRSFEAIAAHRQAFYSMEIEGRPSRADPAGGGAALGVKAGLLFAFTNVRNPERGEQYHGRDEITGDEISYLLTIVADQKCQGDEAEHAGQRRRDCQRP